MWFVDCWKLSAVDCCLPTLRERIVIWGVSPGMRSVGVCLAWFMVFTDLGGSLCAGAVPCHVAFAVPTVNHIEPH